MNRFAPALVAALLLAPAVAPAQNLGDAASKEKERREKSKKPSKSYTEEDLRGKLNGTMSNPGSTGGTSAAAGASTASGSGEGSTSASPAPDAAPLSPEQEEANAKNWRDRRDYTVGEIARIRAAITSFESRLADNTAPMYGPGRDSLVQNLDRAKADLVRAENDLTTLETEGRSKGYR